MRVLLLQPEEQRTGECARYGDSARVVLGVVDGGGLFGYLGMLAMSVFFLGCGQGGFGADSCQRCVLAVMIYDSYNFCCIAFYTQWDRSL